MQEQLNLFQTVNETQKPFLSVGDFISHFTKFKEYGTKIDGAIFYINEDKLNQDHINQIRNYLNSREKSLKARK